MGVAGTGKGVKNGSCMRSEIGCQGNSSHRPAAHLVSHGDGSTSFSFSFFSCSSFLYSFSSLLITSLAFVFNHLSSPPSHHCGYNCIWLIDSLILSWGLFWGPRSFGLPEFRQITFFSRFSVYFLKLHPIFDKLALKNSLQEWFMGSRAHDEVSLFKISSNSRLKSESIGHWEDREKKTLKSFVLEAQKLKRDFTPPE